MPLPLSNDLTVEDANNLHDYWRILVRHRRLVIWTTCVVVVLTAIIVLQMPNIYRSQTILIPLGKSPSGLQAALGDLGSLLALGRGGNDNPSARVLAILQSRTLAEDVIQRLGLFPYLFAEAWDTTAKRWKTDDPPTMEDAVQAFGALLSSSVDEKRGILTITADYTNPDMAATIANEAVESLQRALNEKSFSLAKKNRLFIDSQLQKVRQDLIKAEEALRQFEQTYGIVALDAQAEATVNTLAGLEGQIIAKEVQLGVMQRSLTTSSREVYLLQEELQGLRTQLARLQQGTGGVSATPEKRESQLLFSVDKAPNIKLQYVRLQREMLLQNKLSLLLTEQLEQAKIDEARDETTFQVLDRAVPPVKKFRPKRGVILALALIVGGLIGISASLAREFMDTTVRTREMVEQQLGLPLLSTLASVPTRRRQRRLPPSSEAGLVRQLIPGEPQSEALRYLYARLKRLSNGQDIQTLLFTSPTLPDETATILVNLALVAAQEGEKALLVDSNILSPTLHHLLQCPLAPGLLDMLAEPEAWQKSIQSTFMDNLHCISGGTATVPRSVFKSSTFDLLLPHFRAAYDVIFFATPPVQSCIDAVMLSVKMDATCLVLTSGKSRLDTSLDAKIALESVQGNVIGVILVG